jgi:hypothetical protein
MDFDLPCIHRGEPTGDEVQCGCSLKMQPAYFCNSPDVKKDRCLMRIGARAKRGVKDTHAECSSCEWRFDDRPVTQGRIKRMQEKEQKRVPIEPRPGDIHRKRQLEEIAARHAKMLADRAAAEEMRKQLLDVGPQPEPEPFDGPVTRNVLYHMGPFSGNGMWRRNVQELVKRIGMFNGRRVMAIVTGDGLDPPEAVREAMAGHDFEFIEMPNESRLREVVSFIPLLKTVESLDKNSVTFYAHSKGVTRPVDSGTTVHAWTDIMYATCLDYWPVVERMLASYPIVGSFKKLGHGFQGSDSNWHYSGTYYWLRHSGVFGRKWQLVDQQWWGTESWPGVQFKPEEAGCLFRTGSVPELDLYNYSYFHGSIVPDYLDWKRRHDADMRVW